MGMGKSTFTFSKPTIVLGVDTTRIGITRDNQSYSHKLATKYGDIATLPVGTTYYDWTPTADVLAQAIKDNPNIQTFNITVTLYTYNGTTEVGWDAHLLTINLNKSDFRPDVTAEFSDSYGVYSVVGGYPCTIPMRLLLTINTKFEDSEIEYKDCTFAIDGIPTGYSHTFGKPPSMGFDDINIPFNKDGTFIFSVKITDSRSFEHIYEYSILFYEYTYPKITNLNVVRCDSDGNISNDGTCVKYRFDYDITSLDSKNTKSCEYGYRIAGNGDDPDEWINVSLNDYSGTIESIITDFNFNVDTDYEFIFYCYDIRYKWKDLYNKSSYILVSNPDIMSISSDGKNISLGLNSSDTNQISITEDGGVSIGFDCSAPGSHSMAVGLGTIASGGMYESEDHSYFGYMVGQMAIGKYNVAKNGPLFIIGNGYSDNLRKNILELYPEGKLDFKGDINIDGMLKQVPTELLYQNLNDITKTGTYFAGLYCSPRPTTTYGWLEVMHRTFKYDNGEENVYCVQTYTAFDGSGAWRRYMTDGTWGDWNIFGVGGGSLETLWTNPSPTKAYASNTIELDLSSYAGVIITFKNMASNPENTSTYPYSYWFFPIPSDGTKYSRRITCGWINGASTNANRLVRVSKTEVVFETGRTGNTNNGNYAIPLKIEIVK